jgi:hypothetical protein
MVMAPHHPLRAGLSAFALASVLACGAARAQPVIDLALSDA